MAKKQGAGVRWIIEGFDGTEIFLRRTIPKGSSWSEARIIELLRRLVCHHLSPGDVIEGSRPPKDIFYVPILEAKRSTEKRLTITVGENPFYVASLYRANEKDHWCR
jgi:hypothetical protein